MKKKYMCTNIHVHYIPGSFSLKKKHTQRNDTYTHTHAHTHVGALPGISLELFSFFGNREQDKTEMENRKLPEAKSLRGEAALLLST